MEEQNLSLAQAAIQFLAGLPPQARDESHQEVNRFIRWYGVERPLGAGPDIGPHFLSLALC